MIMKAIRDKLKSHQYLYYVYREIMNKRGERKLLWKDAVRQFEEGTAKHGNLKEYKRALYRQRFMYDEYNLLKNTINIISSTEIEDTYSFTSSIIKQIKTSSLLIN